MDSALETSGSLFEFAGFSGSIALMLPIKPLKNKKTLLKRLYMKVWVKWWTLCSYYVLVYFGAVERHSFEHLLRWLDGLRQGFEVESK